MLRSDVEKAYRAAVANHRAASELVKSHGLLAETAFGQEVVAPWVKVQQDSAALIARLARVLAALPQETTEEDPLDDLASRRARRRAGPKVS